MINIVCFMPRPEICIRKMIRESALGMRLGNSETVLLTKLNLIGLGNTY